MGIKYTIADLKDLLKQRNYRLLFEQEFQGMNNKYYIIDEVGYKYYCNLSNFKKGVTPDPISKSNPFSIENIGIWLSTNAPNYESLESKFSGNSTLMWWKMKDDKLPPFKKTWNNFKYRPWHSELKIDNPQKALRYSFNEVKKLFEELLEKFEGGWYITDGELHKYKSVNHLVVINNGIYEAVTNITKLRAGDSPYPFNHRHVELATRNLAILARSKGYELKQGERFTSKQKEMKFICKKHGEFPSPYMYFARNTYPCWNCNIDSRTGEKHWRWNGGDEEADRRRQESRNYPEYAEWVKAVYKKYGYKCFICEQSGSIQAHHKDAHHWCVERRTDITNGVCLCMGCHFYFHNMFGSKNNTEKQYEKWEKIAQQEFKNNPTKYKDKVKDFADEKCNNYVPNVNEKFISYHQKTRRWIVKIQKDVIGYYILLKDAIQVRDNKAKELNIEVPQEKDGHVIGKAWTKESAIKVAKRKGLTLDNPEAFETGKIKLLAYTEEGYKVIFTPQFHHGNVSPSIFYIYNPHTLWNIKNIWVPKYASEYELKDNTYINAYANMTWINKNDNSKVIKSWSKFRKQQEDLYKGLDNG